MHFKTKPLISHTYFNLFQLLDKTYFEKTNSFKGLKRVIEFTWDQIIHKSRRFFGVRFCCCF